MKPTSPPLVSIVTPVYNTEKYLGECIESVLKQSCDNFEYIIADNCSTDDSLNIAKKYATKDLRIRIVQNDRFLEQIPNYNHSLRQISRESKYCKIVQADDFIFPECIERMAELAERHPSIGVVSAYHLLEASVGLVGLPYHSTFISGKEICRLYLLEEVSLVGSQTSVLFRSDLVRERDPFFNEESCLPDAEACYEILAHNDFGFVHQVLTYIRNDNESYSSSIKDYNPYLIHNMICLRKFGPVHLTTEEIRRKWREVEWRYYKYLGRKVLKPRNLRNAGFWGYHRGALGYIGYKISNTKIILHALLEILDALLNPAHTARRLAGRLNQDVRED